MGCARAGAKIFWQGGGIVVTSTLKRFLSGDSLRVAVWIAVGGVSIMLGNLMLADVLETDDFGRLTLVEAVLSVGTGLGSLGFTDLVVRQEIPARWRSIGEVALLTLLPSAVVGAILHVVYDLSLVISILVAVGCSGGSVGLLCASFDRADVRLNRALVVTQAPFVFFVVAALCIYVLDESRWQFSVLALVGGYTAGGLFGLALFGLRGKAALTMDDPRSHFLSRGRKIRKALNFLGISTTALVFAHLERLIIPRALTIEDLAVFGIAATLVFGPYKLLQGGIGYGLMPRLRTAVSDAGRRALIKRELRFAIFSALVFGVGAVVLVPGVTRYLYADKYAVGVGLVLVLVLSGTLRAVYGVIAASAKALADKRLLTLYHASGWASFGLAIVAGLLLADFGLNGLVIGVAIGWLARVVIDTVIARKALQEVDRVGTHLSNDVTPPVVGAAGSSAPV